MNIRYHFQQRLKGAVLLEVILALVLFVGAALVIGGGLSASVTSLERNRRSAHAVNLAVSVISEMQMGIKPVGSSGPFRFNSPHEQWSWETVVEDGAEEVKLRRVEVVIRMEDEGYVFRMAELLPGDRPGREGEE